jgi:hypothetical protein
MSNSIELHCQEIERCNQRGGRMLSVVDLLLANTLTIDLAAYLLAAIRSGASFMVGAQPGGAGKTTVMAALLNFVPSNVELRPADGQVAIDEGRKPGARRGCYICHEIGQGGYYAYLWDELLRAYFELTRHGHMLATNLHADTIEAARHQICVENGVPATTFNRMNLVLFLRVQGGQGGDDEHREIAEVWESQGASQHQVLFRSGKLFIAASRLVEPAQFERGQRLLTAVRSAGARTIEEVRAVLIHHGL